MIYSGFLRKFVTNIILVGLGALVFSLGFPSFAADWGWAGFAWFSVVPVVILIRRLSWWSTPLWGVFYGYVTYTVFNFWLASFNPVSFVIVPMIYACWFFLIFPLLYLVDRAFPRYGWLAQFLVWAAYEVGRTKGFLAYSYGILGYSQYRWLNLIGIADVFGVMGVSLLVAFPSFLLGGWLLEGGVLTDSGALSVPSPRQTTGRRWILAAGIWAALLLAANVYGAASKVDYSDSPRWRPALIQHNMNSWLSGVDVWRQALTYLIEESKRAEAEAPDALIWSETAFVPAIEWHLKYRREREKVDMIKELLDYSAGLDIPVITGNNDAYMNSGHREEYNAVILLDKTEIKDRYWKIHLVPFSEYFPYARWFPRLMRYIEDQGTPLYLKGSEFTTFDLGKWGGPVISPMICFEDTFGYLSRNFVRNGAEVLVNLTNDSWSPQPAASIQHQNIAIFRAVENRRSMVRSTNSGLTSVIDPNGRILARLEPFTRDYLIADVPVYTERNTIYTRYGNWFKVVIAAVALPLILAAILILVFRRRSSS